MTDNHASADIPLCWKKYIDFENCVRVEDGDLNTFIMEWEAKMAEALSAGCHYSDLVLALKLIEKANLGSIPTAAIISNIRPSVYDNFLHQVVAKIKEQNNVTRFSNHLRVQNSDQISNSNVKVESNLKEEKSFDEELDNDISWTCNECSCQLIPYSEDPSDVFQCPNCEKYFMLKSDTGKQAKFVPVPVCPQCSKPLIEPSNLNSGEVSRDVSICTSCKHVFDDFSAISENASAKRDANGEKIKVDKSGNKPRTDKDTLKCPICSKAFELKAILEKHIQWYHNDQRRLSNGTVKHGEGNYDGDMLFDEDSMLKEQEIKEEIILETGLDSVVNYGVIKASKTTTKRRKKKGTGKLPSSDLGGLIVREKKSSAASLAGSRKVPSRVPCEICGKSVALTRVKSHVATHTATKDIECTVCQKRFASDLRLKIHMETHKTMRDFICSYCGKGFKTKATMKEHMNLHTKSKVHACKSCDKTFLFYSSLRLHIRVHHTGIKPYKCDFCELTFFTSSNRVRHMRVHTGEKPFRCEVCGKQFSDFNGRKRHVKNVHNKGNPVTS